MNLETIKMPTTVEDQTESTEQAENSIEGQIENELANLQENLAELQSEAQALQGREAEIKLDDKQEKNIFANVNKIIYAAAALIAVPTALSFIDPKKIQEINQAISGLVNNPGHVETILGACGIFIAILGYDAIKKTLHHKNGQAELELIELAQDTAQRKKWDGLSAHLETLANQMAINQTKNNGAMLKLKNALQKIEDKIEQAPGDKKPTLLAQIAEIKNKLLN